MAMEMPSLLTQVWGDKEISELKPGTEVIVDIQNYADSEHFPSLDHGYVSEATKDQLSLEKVLALPAQIQEVNMYHPDEIIDFLRGWPDSRPQREKDNKMQYSVQLEKAPSLYAVKKDGEVDSVALRKGMPSLTEKYGKNPEIVIVESLRNPENHRTIHGTLDEVNGYDLTLNPGYSELPIALLFGKNGSKKTLDFLRNFTESQIANSRSYKLTQVKGTTPIKVYVVNKPT